MIDLSKFVDKNVKVTYPSGRTENGFITLNKDDRVTPYKFASLINEGFTYSKNGEICPGEQCREDIVKIEEVTEDLYPPKNQFIVPITVGLYEHERLQLRKYLNLHYLGDVDANELDENRNLVAKYPEKETEEFKNAVWNADATHRVEVLVTFDINGLPKLEFIND